VTVLGSLDFVIAITSNLSCNDLRDVAAAVSITDAERSALPPACNMCVLPAQGACHYSNAEACERPQCLDGLRGRVNALLGSQQTFVSVAAARHLHRDGPLARSSYRRRRPLCRLRFVPPARSSCLRLSGPQRRLCVPAALSTRHRRRQHRLRLWWQRRLVSLVRSSC
jgi:hypothetical protein